MHLPSLTKVRCWVAAWDQMHLMGLPGDRLPSNLGSALFNAHCTDGATEAPRKGGRRHCVAQGPLAPTLGAAHPQLPGASKHLCSSQRQPGPSPEEVLLEEEPTGPRGCIFCSCRSSFNGADFSAEPSTPSTIAPGPYASAGLGLG